MKGRLRRAQGSPEIPGSGVDDPQSQIHWYLMGLVLTYTAWLIMTPYNRFDFLSTIRFERVLMLITLVVAFASGRITLARGKLSVMLVLFLLTLYVSHFLTPDRYARSSMVVQWTVDYWKLIVLYFVLAAAIHTRKELTVYALGTLAILTFYWAYTLNDYRGGGSYVWQQGVPRMVGVWVPRDVGAANYTGVVGVLMIPFSVFCADVYRNYKGRIVSLVTLALAMTVVILSGTRGALIASLGLLLWTFRRQLFKIKWLATATIGVYLAIALLPPNLTERYLSVFSSKSDTSQLDSYAQQQASDSAKSRIEGLEDGYALFRNRPVLGYGPGASSAARGEVTEFPVTSVSSCTTSTVRCWPRRASSERFCSSRCSGSSGAIPVAARSSWMRKGSPESSSAHRPA